MSNTNKHILSIDQGTTSSKGVLFDPNYEMITIRQNKLAEWGNAVIRTLSKM